MQKSQYTRRRGMRVTFMLFNKHESTSRNTRAGVGWELDRTKLVMHWSCRNTRASVEWEVNYYSQTISKKSVAIHARAWNERIALCITNGRPPMSQYTCRSGMRGLVSIARRRLLWSRNTRVGVEWETALTSKLFDFFCLNKNQDNGAQHYLD